mmetsp:Transcript_15655/g.28013  ORF Transcript_15655/g.28013 Transcript_15655/m.28013 type:complete len:170 (+) Transcript_15655:74-583(+)
MLKARLNVPIRSRFLSHHLDPDPLASAKRQPFQIFSKDTISPSAAAKRFIFRLVNVDIGASHKAFHVTDSIAATIATSLAQPRRTPSHTTLAKTGSNGINAIASPMGEVNLATSFSLSLFFSPSISLHLPPLNSLPSPPNIAQTDNTPPKPTNQPTTNQFTNPGGRRRE